MLSSNVCSKFNKVAFQKYFSLYLFDFMNFFRKTGLQAAFENLYIQQILIIKRGEI